MGESLMTDSMMSDCLQFLNMLGDFALRQYDGRNVIDACTQHTYQSSLLHIQHHFRPAPLHDAIRKKDVNKLCGLLQQGDCDVEQRDFVNGYTPLFLAVWQRRGLEYIRALVEAGADVNVVCGGMTLLERASGDTLRG